MKKIAILLLSLFVFYSCNEDTSIDTTVMPEETTKGANTFGCLVDGWLYVGGRYNNYTYDPLWGEWGGNQSILFNYYPSEELMEVQVKVKEDLFIKFNIENPQHGATVRFYDATFGGEYLEEGKVTITRFDKDANIISGRFEGGRITHGRFDVVYYDMDEIEAEKE